MSILGLHHISLICNNAQRTADFYTKVLGLRLVKRTVNFDSPETYHLYFGDEIGRPGTLVTFFELPSAPKGHPGIGGTHHFAMQARDEDGLLKWKRRLTDLGCPVDGPLDRNYFKSIYFRDPDGVILEIATRGPGWAVDEEADSLGASLVMPPQEMLLYNRDKAAIEAITWQEPVERITEDMELTGGMHHITAIGVDIHRTDAFYRDLLGMRLLKRTVNFDDPDSAHWYWGGGDGGPGTILTYFERDPDRETRAIIGAGQTHHFALAVEDEDIQLEWREKLIAAGYEVTPVLDRLYFKSIYTRDPDGHIIELATLGPGFLIDEDEDQLGSSLRLPPWLEKSREQVEEALKPISV